MFMHPVFLMGLATSAALFPYFLWIFDEKNQYYDYQLSLGPLIVWLVGFAGFVFGSQMAHQFYSASQRFDFELATVNRVLVPITLMVMILAVCVIYSYGTIPMVSYFYGGYTVWDANNSQINSQQGLMGLFAASHIVASAFAATNLAQRRYKKVSIFWPVVLLLLLTLVSLVSGKRQGLFMLFTMVTAALIYWPSPKKRSVPRLSAKSAVGWVIGAIILVSVFGMIGRVRVDVEDERSGVKQILNYLEYPLINLEHQTAMAAVPLSQDYWSFGPLVRLLPYSFIQDLLANDPRPMPLLESGAGSGFWGEVYWHWGYAGLVFVSVFIGFFTTVLFVLAKTRTLFFIIYLLCVWPLMSGHSYNHFFNLVFFMLPLIITLVTWLIARSSCTGTRIGTYAKREINV